VLAGSRSKGMGLAGFSTAIQDQFKQCFASGILSADDVPDSIYDSLTDFDGDDCSCSLGLAFCICPCSFVTLPLHTFNAHSI
jgi:hypothetical protein